jgi:hypothetical protein
MDFFGIGAAVRSMLTVYLTSSRRTGRTLSMVESVKDGDRIIFTNSLEAGRVKRLLQERKVDVECRVMAVHENPLSKFGTAQGRTIFDHTWVEEYYAREIEEAMNRLDHLERAMSGYGPTHRETRRKSLELAKWRP